MAPVDTIFLLLALAVIVQSAPNNCSTQYEAALQRVLDLKESCSQLVYKDCCEAYAVVKLGANRMHSNAPASGVYEISHVCGDKPHIFHTSIPALHAHCSNGGWTVILRRNASVSQPVNFTRTWNDYKHGFGNLNTEFWYGLRNIHCLTTRQQVDLRIEFKYANGTEQIYTYQYFKVNGSEDKFTLHIGQLQNDNYVLGIV